LNSRRGTTPIRSTEEAGKTAMKIDRLPPVRTSLQPTNHPYMTGAWTPLHEEVDAVELEVLEGAIPTDLDGVYLRNTENPVHQPLGRYHPFDGDGMVHQIEFRSGQATYRNRFIRTRGFEAEQEAGESLWGGLADGPRHLQAAGLRRAREPEGHRQHRHRRPSRRGDRHLLPVRRGLSAGSPDPGEPGRGVWAPLDGVSAHAKVDEATGELMFFNYSKHAPYMHYGVVDAAGKRTVYQPIDLPGPRLPHDMAFTANYSILNDLPVFWDAGLLERDIHAVRLHKGVPSRFGIVPRHGGEVRWFEAAPTYVLHWLNAYEDGDEIVLDGYFQENPTPRPLEDAPEGHGHLMAYLDEHSFRPKLHRWRFNLATGETTEQHLDERILEFGMFNQAYAGRPYRYAYSTTAKPGWFLFNGFVKHDLETGVSWTLPLEPGRYASEAPFAPRVGASTKTTAIWSASSSTRTAGPRSAWWSTPRPCNRPAASPCPTRSAAARTRFGRHGSA
jgi:carotenoid cleavage dioxygenase-like enzyme